MNGLDSAVHINFAAAGTHMSLLQTEISLVQRSDTVQLANCISEGIDASAGRVDGQGINGASNVNANTTTSAVAGEVQGIATGLALTNISAQSDQHLMFMKGERVVLLEKLGNGLCMGYCEGVVGQFKEGDVDFEVQAHSSSTPTIASISSDKKTRDAESSPRPRNNAFGSDEVSAAASLLPKHSPMSPAAMDPSLMERLGPRKPASEENLKTSDVGAVERRQILSLPLPHLEGTGAAGSADVSVPTIPPRSSSRQSKTQKSSSGLKPLGTKSSTSSINSLADPNGSSASIVANSLEIKSNDFMSDSNRLSPIPFQQRSRPFSRKNSEVSDGSPLHPLSSTSIQAMPVPTESSQHPFDEQPQPQQKFEKEGGHHENESYLSSVLEDIRAKTKSVLHIMSPTAGLYGDHGEKEVDLRVVQMLATTAPTSNDRSSPPNVSLSTATSPTMLQEAKAGSSDPAISIAISAAKATTTIRPAKAISISGNITSAPIKPMGRPRSRSIRGGTKPPQITSLSDSSDSTSTTSTAPHSMFEKFRPWVKSDQRQRAHSGPAWLFDSGNHASQKEDGNDQTKLYIPQHEIHKVSWQRRASEATIATSISSFTSQSFQSHMTSIDQRAGASTPKPRSKNWFGIGRRGSALPTEDMRKPHPLGNGIEGGIVSPKLSPYMDEDEDVEDDSDDDDDVEDEGSKENSRMYINDFGFIYDLDDEMNQGQDLTGTGSAIGSSSLGSNVSSLSETERRKASRRHKRNRENELKWIHAATNLHADSVKKSTKYKKLVRLGVPTSVRGRVWLFLAKADLYRQPGLFSELCKRGPLPIHEVIERDIHRCYPDHIHFRDGLGGTGQQDLHAILKAYAHYKPSVGYCQGMGRLVGMMLMQMPVEDAFWLLVATIEGYMQDYYTPSLRQLRIDAQVFERLLKDQDPTLAEHLEKNDVIPLMYMTQWFMTLYTMSLPWASVLLVWDVFYYDGVKALFRVGLAILHLCRDHLLNKCPTSSELLAYILHIPLENLAPKPLLDATLQIKLKKQAVQKLIAVTAVNMDTPPPTSSSTSSSTTADRNPKRSIQRTTST
ncbi:hypothetical protein BGX27_007497, partial [Mortierella sp. AM989]